MFDPVTGACVVVVRIDPAEPVAAGKKKMPAAAAHEPAASDEDRSFMLAVDIGLASRYPFEVPKVTVQSGSLPEGATVPETDPPEVVSPADSDVWTPSHSIATLASTIRTYVQSGMPWPQPGGGAPGAPGAAAAAEEATPQGAPLFSQGLIVPLSLVRDAYSESMYPCKPAAANKWEEIKIALYPPRALVLTERQIAVVEESRLRPSMATVLVARAQADLSKLHFRQGSPRLSLVFKPLPTATAEKGPLVVDLASPAEAKECVADIRSRLAAQGVAGTRSSAAKAKALARADELLVLASTRQAALTEALAGDLASGGTSAALVDDVAGTMDLYRQAAEQYGAMGDPRHEEVLAAMHAFLSTPDAQAVLTAPAPVPLPATPGPPPPPPLTAAEDDTVVTTAAAEDCAGEGAATAAATTTTTGAPKVADQVVAAASVMVAPVAMAPVSAAAEAEAAAAKRAAKLAAAGVSVRATEEHSQTAAKEAEEASASGAAALAALMALVGGEDGGADAATAMVMGDNAVKDAAQAQAQAEREEEMTAAGAEAEAKAAAEMAAAAAKAKADEEAAATKAAAEKVSAVCTCGDRVMTCSRWTRDIDESGS